MRLEILEETWKLLEGTVKAWQFPKMFYKNKTFPKEETIMKKSLVLAMAMALGVTASAYAANPFSDVPAGHWAYDSVAKLAAAGVVDGYADGAFDGDKLMTRYEMAQIVAKAMAKGADCDKLAAEFADELDTLGVRVAKLEKGADNVKITGETRLRYWAYDDDGADDDKMQLRTRIFVKGQVNDDWSATAMLENVEDIAGQKGDDGGEETVKLQRAYVNGKLGGLAVQAGRYSFCDYLGGLVYDNRMDAVQVAYGKEVKVTAAVGKGANASGTYTKLSGGEYVYDGTSDAGDLAYVQAETKIGMVDVKAAYYKFDDVQNTGYPKVSDGFKAANVEIYAIGLGMPVAKDLKLAGYYLFNESEDLAKDASGDDGFVVELKYKGASASKPGSWGAWAKYYDQPQGTYVDPTWEHSDAMNGFEGYGVGVDYAFAKNMVAQVKYYDIDAKDGAKDEKSTLYAQLNVSF